MYAPATACDSDGDCAAGLECYQRGVHGNEVPGCSGRFQDLRGTGLTGDNVWNPSVDGDDDFCYDPDAPHPDAVAVRRRARSHATGSANLLELATRGHF
jgi:hypothetical protein